MKTDSSAMKAMIFAAGLGTRLRPLTDSMPKALVPVNGRPLIAHVLEKLRRAGFGEVVVNVHHFSSMLSEYLRDNGFGVKIDISDESSLLRDTGGGIMYAEPFLKGSGRFLVHNVDILSNLDLRRFVRRAQPDALAVLVVSRRETSRYLLFDGNMRLVGWTNVSTGEVKTPYPSLDPEKCRKMAFSGIHLISDGIFGIFREKSMPEAFSIIDFYLEVCAEYPVYGYVPEDFRMLDVGKPEALASAGDFIKD